MIASLDKNSLAVADDTEKKYTKKDARRKKKMKVSGKSAFTLKKIIDKKSHSAN